jgi:tRNA uridine 5-carbamoylmethylation protein Kti12
MVKPVDLQDNLSKTQLLDKVHQSHKSMPEEAQKQFAQELQKKLIEGKEKVTDLPKSDKIIIHRDEKKEKEKKDKQESKKQDDDQKPDENSSNENKKIDYIA